MIPAKHWIQGVGSQLVMKFPSTNVTYVAGQLVYQTTGRLAEPTSASLAKLLGVTPESGEKTATAVPDMVDVYCDPFVIYRATMDTTALTDTGAAGSGVFTAAHEADIGAFAVIMSATTLVTGQVARVSAISTSTTFTLTEPDGAGTYSAAVGDTCIIIPRLGGVCETDDDTVKIMGNEKDGGDLLMVDYGEKLRRAVAGTNTIVDTASSGVDLHVFVSLAQKHVSIAGGDAAA